MAEDESDTALFRAAMSDVRPLSTQQTAELRRRRPPPIPGQRHADDRAVLRELAEGERDGSPLGAELGEALAYARPGLNRRTLKRLRRGEFSVMAELDLHGQTVEPARRLLSDFLNECHRRHLGCVRVIHGKGRRSSNTGPVLKGQVDRWLRQREDVLAFCSARPVDGGTGALYVLLRR
ncbi:Smr/MutS family protein [Spiribacter pallidus]|jgi:DNA-nicking Smr family endonuclease|uniref:Smr/MutS family protein n=1 Tax=Spiribacter pallidus TaxID=1987936 RepID=A0ABV3TC34_9GAMM